MGHANVDTTLNVYTQVLDGSLREAVDKVGGGLLALCFTKLGREGRERIRPCMACLVEARMLLGSEGGRD